MDEYVVEVDDTLETIVAWVRAYQQGRTEPPWLDLGDRILWFPDDDTRQAFLAKPEDERLRRQTWLPCLGWWSGTLALIAGREEALDAAQHDLLTTMARERSVHLLANGVHATPIDDLVDPERYE